MIKTASKYCRTLQTKYYFPFFLLFLGDLRGEYLVNNLDLSMEVMRYDVENIVTGLKILSNVDVETLKADENSVLQKVPLIHWLKTAIYKTSNYNITGQKIFDGFVEFKNGIQ